MLMKSAFKVCAWWPGPSYAPTHDGSHTGHDLPAIVGGAGNNSDPQPLTLRNQLIIIFNMNMKMKILQHLQNVPRTFFLAS